MKWIRRLFEKPTPQTMVEHLLDKSAELGERDDVAMDLAEYDLPEVEAALIRVATDHSEAEMIIDSAGESLSEIWSRQGREPPRDVIEKMHPSAQKFFDRDDA